VVPRRNPCRPWSLPALGAAIIGLMPGEEATPAAVDLSLPTRHPIFLVTFFFHRPRLAGSVSPVVIEHAAMLVATGWPPAKIAKQCKVDERMDRLNRYEATTAYPFLLNVYRDYEQKKLSEGDFLTLLDMLESFLIRRFICGVATSGLTKIFPALYSQARSSSSLEQFTKPCAVAIMSIDVTVALV
jgi:hypothetical protein